MLRRRAIERWCQTYRDKILQKCSSTLPSEMPLRRKGIRSGNSVGLRMQPHLVVPSLALFSMVAPPNVVSLIQHWYADRPDQKTVTAILCGT